MKRLVICSGGEFPQDIEDRLDAESARESLDEAGENIPLDEVKPFLES
jgi:hypothetical protein